MIGITPKTRKSEMVWNKELGIYLLPKENEQPVVNLNYDVIYSKAEQAYKEFVESDNKIENFINRCDAAITAANCVPEILELLKEAQKHIEIIKEQNEAHLTAREELWRQEAFNLAVMYEKENL